MCIIFVSLSLSLSLSLCVCEIGDDPTFCKHFAKSPFEFWSIFRLILIEGTVWLYYGIVGGSYQQRNCYRAVCSRSSYRSVQKATYHSFNVKDSLFLIDCIEIDWWSCFRLCPSHDSWVLSPNYALEALRTLQLRSLISTIFRLIWRLDTSAGRYFRSRFCSAEEMLAAPQQPPLDCKSYSTSRQSRNETNVMMTERRCRVEHGVWWSWGDHTACAQTCSAQARGDSAW